MNSRVPESSSAARLLRPLAGLTAAALALLFLSFAVSLAATTLEPWGDSPRVVYAFVADVGLGIGVLFLATATTVLGPALGGKQPRARLEPVAYLASAIAVAIPLAISATNSLEASSIGQGGPSTALVVVGGIGLSAALALMMRRRLVIGIAAAGFLAFALFVVALIAGR